jgi:demethylspheroidene O-methyltransferase
MTAPSLPQADPGAPTAERVGFEPPPALRWHERLSERAWTVRDRLLSRPAFRDWAARTWPLRWIARRRAERAFDLMAGFVHAQVLAACIELRLFDRLAAQPQTAEALARAHGLAPQRLAALLDAACALRLLQRRVRGRYGLGPLGLAFVANPALEAMVEHHPAFYADLAEPLTLLRAAAGSTRLARYWPYAALGVDAAAPLDGDALQTYTRLMARSQPLVAEQVLAVYPFGRHRRMLDIGGGDGSFVAAVAAHAPRLQLELFDLPPVAEAAARRLRDAGLDARTRVHGGDFHRDALPQGYDLVSLVRVVHDHDDAPVRALLRRAYAALVPGGTLLVAEPMAGTAGSAGVEAYFLLYLLAMGSGMPRSVAQLRGLLAEAGFEQIRRWPTAQPLQCSLLSARRPLGPTSA